MLSLALRSLGQRLLGLRTGARLGQAHGRWLREGKDNPIAERCRRPSFAHQNLGISIGKNVIQTGCPNWETRKIEQPMSRAIGGKHRTKPTVPNVGPLLEQFSLSGFLHKISKAHSGSTHCKVHAACGSRLWQPTNIPSTWFLAKSLLHIVNSDPVKFTRYL